MRKTNTVGLLGYGNLGRGAEKALFDPANQDMELSAIFTRRDPLTIQSASGVPVVSIDKVSDYIGKIDVMILCGGSATDLPVQGPNYAALFNTVDSFDTHAKILEYLETMDCASYCSGHTSIISVGWDPGMFSIQRAYAEAILPTGKTETFWGKGVSQGHSDAIRRIDGVKDAKQYTVPIQSAIEAVCAGTSGELTPRQKHLRECFVVAEEGADRDRIEKEIKEMPNYFADYNTTVSFISEEELQKKHSGMSHGGFVIRRGDTGGNSHVIEYSLKLASNPEFTGSVLVAYARAACRLADKGEYGAKTAFDISPTLLAAGDREDLIKRLL